MPLIRTCYCAAESKLYSKEVSDGVCKWMPGADDFLEAFSGLGYRAPGCVRPKKASCSKGAGNAADQPAAYAGPWPQLTHLRLLLRLLGPICRAQVGRPLPFRDLLQMLSNTRRTWRCRAISRFIGINARNVIPGAHPVWQKHL